MSALKLLSVNVGMPREIDWHGRFVRTSIFKSPVLGSVRVATLNLEGDKQLDLTVHGGVHKAVYAYPSEHYRLWRQELPDLDLSWGAFGENFTTEGLLEKAVTLVIASGLGLQSLLSLNHECVVSSPAFGLAAQKS